MHRAVDYVDLDVVWPEYYSYDSLPLASVTGLHFRDNDISGNRDQATAVVSITNKSYKNRFVIHVTLRSNSCSY